eukprot:scaffold1091_cov164-Ochromonas_danica.AAC.18
MNSKKSLLNFKAEEDGIERMLALDLMKPAYNPPSASSTAGFVGDREDNPVVFLEISAAGGRRLPSGEISSPRVIGSKGLCEDGINYHYKNTSIHRIIKNSMFQGGDLLGMDGECSKSIFDGRYFRDENFLFRHTGPGCISYCNRGPDTNGSLFQVTFRKMPDLDEQYVVFGCLADKQSFEVLRLINRLGSASGEPLEQVSISDCGIAYQKESNS